MPQVVAVIAQVVVSVLIPLGVPKFIALAIGSFVANLAVTAVGSALMRASQPKPRSMQQGQELQTKIDSAMPREIGVGLFSTGGSLGWEGVSGTTNEYLWRVIPISDAEINQILIVLGNGKTLTFSGDIHTGHRECTSHFKDDNGTNCLTVRIYKGTSTQTADATLLAAFPGILDSNFRGRGIAYAIVRMTYSQSAWGGGADLVFIGEGALCYDPRTGATAYTDNPVVIGRQFLKGFYNNGFRVLGMGVADRTLPSADYIASANECDELIALKAGGTEKRYRMGGMISARESPREVIANICAAMGGEHIDRGGQIVLLPGVWRAPLFDVAETLNEGPLAVAADAPFTYVARRTANERVNAIVSTHVNPNDGFQESALPPRKDAAAITADGDRYETTRAWRYVYSRTQGQRLDQIVLRAARCEGFLAYQAPLWGFEMSPGDVHTMTNRRWLSVQKYWKLDSLNIAISSGMVSGAPVARTALQLRETAPSVYAWDPATDEIDDYIVATLTIPALASLALSGFALTTATVSTGGVIQPELRFAWTAVAANVADTVEVQYRRTGALAVLYSATYPAADGLGAVTEGVYPNQAYEARAKLRAGDREGAWTAWATPVTTSAVVQVNVIDQQTDWATFGGDTDRVQYLDDTGRVNDYRLLPLNASGGVAGSFSAAPLSGLGTQIDVAAVTWSGVGGTISVGSGSFPGLSASTRYWFFWDVVGATHVYTSTYATAQTYYSNATRYLALGSRTTSGGGNNGGAGGITP